MDKKTEYPFSVNITVAVPEKFSAFVDAVLVRMGYLHPMLHLSKTEKTIEISGISEHTKDVMQRDTIYMLYREKIYQDTLGMRNKLLQVLTKR